MSMNMIEYAAYLQGLSESKSEVKEGRRVVRKTKNKLIRKQFNKTNKP